MSRVPTFTRRNLIARLAADHGVTADDVDRAIILGQLASVLAAHRRIGKRLAFKGGAMLHLIDASPRFSADLDASTTTGRAIRREWIEEAMRSDLGRRMMLAEPRIEPGKKAWVLPDVQCRALGGRPPITLKVSINWSAPLLCEPEWRGLRSHELQLLAGEAGISPPQVLLPVVALDERIAEKLRAFVVRGQPEDAYDLAFHAEHSLDERRVKHLVQMVPVKLSEAIPEMLEGGEDLHKRFQTMISRVANAWPGQLVVRGGAPAWNAVEPLLRTYLETVPVTNRAGVKLVGGGGRSHV